ncbi:MAG TPA: hypothetical protein VEH57_04225 [Thermoplasmata archaeon]|nr:hypothetical protein [Thermoplasmata archaeon]
MVDRVYRGGIPKLRKALEQLRKEFSRVKVRTDWVRLRVDPVLKHAKELERLLSSRRFSAEFSRLTKGVALFHSDLVYLRTNVKALQKLLETEKAREPR